MANTHRGSRPATTVRRGRTVDDDLPTPRRVRIYQNHHLDSTNWDAYRPRPGDVVISTSVKAGTTWMQRILSLLVLGSGPLPDTLFRVSPWLDTRFMEPLDVMIDRIESQSHRRFLKSHLPLDALPYHPEVFYICVGRDTRDMFMSLWHHYRSYTDPLYEILAAGDPPGGPLPRCPDDPRELWRAFMTRGSFPWESDGWPFWSHHYHAASFWSFRHLPNVLMVHYNDMLADLAGEMRRVADFVGLEPPSEEWPALVDQASFATMKRDVDRLLGDMSLPFKDGAATLVYKGTNGRWREVLEDPDLALYEHAASGLDPALRGWLESGRSVVDPHRARSSPPV